MPPSRSRPRAARIPAALDLSVFRQMADMSNEAFFLQDRHGRYHYVNDRACTLTGFSREELLGMTLFDLDPEYPREEFGAVVDALAHNPLPPFESRTRRRDGSYFPVEVSVARIDIDGAPYVFGVVRDITERKQMEAVQRSLAQRMLETLEAERQRVADELHDDVGQAVASVGDLIRSLEQASGAVPDEARPALAATNGMIREITASVARIVQDYHPSELIGLGLEEPLRAHARQFADRHGLALRLATTSIAGLLTPEQELHVYRIVQEALANVAHHAAARQVTVRLRRHQRQVVVSVQDDGVGFEPAQERSAVGLGLVTMRERAELMRAALEIRSAPGHGTAIRLVVPVTAVATAADTPIPHTRAGRARRTPRGGSPRATASRRTRGVAARRER